VPYRIDIRTAGQDAFDRLVELGALDVEVLPDGMVAALLPDGVTPEQVRGALRVDDFSISPAVGRDEDSVWILSPRAVRIGRLRIVPAASEAHPNDLRLIDGAAFGTALHATTALCLEVLQEAVDSALPDAVLDVGTGSGVLALAALMLGVPRATGIDIDQEALRIAAENARLNGVEERLQLTRGGPAEITGAWPLVLANVLAAELIEMAPALAPRVGHHGRLVLSGIPMSVEQDVERAYRRVGMRRVRVLSRAGWIALVMQASW